MSETKCPLCASLSSYAKDPEDQFEVYELELNAGEVVFVPDINEAE